MKEEKEGRGLFRGETGCTGVETEGRMLKRG